MRTIQILEPDDTITADCFVRQLGLIFDGQSDYLSTKTTYSGSPLNRLGWIRASEYCPAWVGKTAGEFNKVMNKAHRRASEKCGYEFVIGNLPRSHIEPKDW